VTPTAKTIASWQTPFAKDPASVSLGDRAAHLLSVEKSMHVAKNVVAAYAFMNLWTTSKEFYSTTGSVIEQTLRQAGAGCGATAVGRDRDTQDRGGPGDFGLYQGGGYEVIDRANLATIAPEYGREAVILADAPRLPTGVTDLLLDGTVLNLQMHESIGHPLELDRSLGWEANFSGISWATPDQVGKLRYGSDLLNVYCDNTMPMGLATVGYDDEAVKPQRVPLIEGGILRGFLSSRDTAAQVDLPQTASTRAQDWASVPMVRMTNIALIPQEGTLESIIAETKDGVYASGVRSWSIDDHRLNFQFGPQIGYEIKNGKRGKIYKQPTYTGVTPQFWGSLDRVGGESEYVVWGTPNCGKGEPEQNGRTTHACSVARFRNVKVGVKADA
jgi:TldD protein